MIPKLMQLSFIQNRKEQKHPGNQIYLHNFYFSPDTIYSTFLWFTFTFYWFVQNKLKQTFRKIQKYHAGGKNSLSDIVALQGQKRGILGKKKIEKKMNEQNGKISKEVSKDIHPLHFWSCFCLRLKKNPVELPNVQAVFCTVQVL